MSIAVAVENVSKKFLLSHQGRQPYTALRDVLAQTAGGFLKSPWKYLRSRASHATVDEFWALRDINFEVNTGDRIGIIGRNGAGKSTLLKILSRISDPTQGRIRLRGRVASLLEVGTGFHPELTGRENIFLNGVILGMNKAEVRKKFDEIVAFADVEMFLDTPVKHYSSGMYVRLAFAVAAHLEPDIFIVDEVLAVGDDEFQRKCINQMGKIGSEGRTVLFVSHNMNSILQLTTSSILLNKGQIVSYAPTPQCVDDYLKLQEKADSAGNLPGIVPWLHVVSFAMRQKSVTRRFNDTIVLDLQVALQRSVKRTTVILGFTNTLGARILTCRGLIHEIPPGQQRATLEIADHRLVPGTYFIHLALWMDKEQAFLKDDILTVDILADEIDEPLLLPLVNKGRDRFGCFCPIGISVER